MNKPSNDRHWVVEWTNLNGNHQTVCSSKEEADKKVESLENAGVSNVSARPTVICANCGDTGYTRSGNPCRDHIEPGIPD